MHVSVHSCTTQALRKHLLFQCSCVAGAQEANTHAQNTHFGRGKQSISAPIGGAGGDRIPPPSKVRCVLGMP